MTAARHPLSLRFCLTATENIRLSRVGCGAGPGFYFALQASKSHEYPPREMQALPPGTHSRSMLLCKVAKGKVFRSERNMDTLTQPPDGFHSVLGVATEEGPLNYDELVVYDEAAILPCAALSVPPVLGGACAALLTFAVPCEVRLFLSPIRVGTFLALVASRRLTGRVWPPQLGQGDVRVRQAGGHRARRRGRPGAPRTQPSEALSNA